MGGDAERDVRCDNFQCVCDTGASDDAGVIRGGHREGGRGRAGVGLADARWMWVFFTFDVFCFALAHSVTSAKELHATSRDLAGQTGNCTHRMVRW